MLQPLLTAMTTLYRLYPAGYVSGWSICVTAAVAAHLWPTWTSQWRTIAWAWFVMAGVGSAGLQAGWGAQALTASVAAALVVIGARANQNARRVGDQLVRWWQFR